MLRVVGSNLKMVKFEPTTPNMPQHIATRWPNARNMLRPTMLRHVALACCDRLAGASRKPAWFKRARAGVNFDAINYATKCTTEINANSFQLKSSCYLSKFTLKSNCKYTECKYGGPLGRRPGRVEWKRG